MELNQIENFFKETIKQVKEGYINEEVVSCKLTYEADEIKFEIEDESCGMIYLNVNGYNTVCDEITIKNELWIEVNYGGRKVGEIKLNHIKSMNWEYDY